MSVSLGIGSGGHQCQARRWIWNKFTYPRRTTSRSFSDFTRGACEIADGVREGKGEQFGYSTLRRKPQEVLSKQGADRSL